MTTNRPPSEELNEHFLDNTERKVSVCQSLRSRKLWKLMIYGMAMAFAYQMYVDVMYYLFYESK